MKNGNTGLPVVTSYGALIRTGTHRREVRVPNRSEFPDTVGWIRDNELGMDVPAVIGITGRFAGVGEQDGLRVAQWQLWVRPNMDRVSQRLARPDLRDIIEKLHEQLTAERPRAGATYTAYFSVPRGGGDNVMRVTFAGAGRFGTDPWLEDDPTAARIGEILRARLTPVFEQLWNSWTKDATVGMLLVNQRIPVAAGGRTQFLGGNTVDHVRAMLPEAMRRTVFLGQLEEIEPETAAEPSEPPTNWNHLATMCAIIGFTFALIVFLVWSAIV